MKTKKLMKTMKKTMTKTYKLHQLIRDMSSEQYHSTPGTFSSTQLKDLLGNLGHFVKKHINKEIEREENDAFDVGTYFHTKVLEPSKLKTECIVYPGKVRRGKDWESFKVKNKGKTIVTEFQKSQAEGLVKAIQDSPIAQSYLRGEPEISLFTEINIYGGEIYAPHYGKVLTRNGWADGPKKRTEKSHKIIIKVRADMLGDTFISDLKSTTGDAESEESMSDKVEYYLYELSAALYLDMFALQNPKLTDFWWLFASKDMFNARAHRADHRTILVGRAKYMYALRRMAEAAANNWQTVDSPGLIAPSIKQMRWLEERETELL